MKKQLVLVLLVSLILLSSGCGRPLVVQPVATPSAVDSVTPAPPPPEPVQTEWAEAYTNALLTRYSRDMENAAFGGAVHIRLQDLDNNGVPELLFSYLGAANSVMFLGYAYREGEIELINFSENDDGWYPQELALYRDKRTGGLQWISHSDFRGGAGYYYHYHTFFDFTDLLNPISESFCAYEEYVIGEGDGATYTLYTNDGGSEPATLEQVEELYADTMSNYKPVLTQEPFSFVRDLLADEPEITFDKDKLLEFFETWDSSAPIPEDYVDTDQIAAVERVSIDYYSHDTAVQESLLNSYYVRPQLEDIRRQVIQYYADNEMSLSYDEYGISNELSYCKVYSLPNIDGYIVIAGDVIYQWPGCLLFVYKDRKLELYPDSKINANHLGIGSRCEEIWIRYNESFPYPFIELYSYSHQGNGEFLIFEMAPDGLHPLVTGGVMGYHFTEWEERRKSPVFNGIALPEGGFFCCRYENGRLTPVYDDVNGDGLTDIVLQGNFQCLGDYDDVLTSQKIIEVYLNNAQSGEFEYDESRSIRSPLADYWFS